MSGNSGKSGNDASEGRRPRLSVGGGEPQAVDIHGSSRHAPELDEDLRSDVKDLAATVGLQDGPSRALMQGIGGIRQPGQDARIDQMGHQS